MLEQNLHDFTQQAVFIKGSRCRTLTRPGSDEIGTINSDGIALFYSRTVIPVFEDPPRVAQLEILADVVEEKVYCRQSYSGWGELTIRRSKTNPHLLNQSGREFALQQFLYGSV
jgi:hypothetical protein